VVTIGIETKFDAAHYLPSYEGKCRNMHGHTWKLTVEIEPTYLNQKLKGMILDFKEFKEVVNQVLDRLDHKVLNNMIDNPTCEAMVELIAGSLNFHLTPHHVRVKEVKLQEGEGGWARYEVR
jgi:6-pyruvoyltetrahydropterin/6-carboxytetrahydropterin synthase